MSLSERPAHAPRYYLRAHGPRGWLYYAGCERDNAANNWTESRERARSWPELHAAQRARESARLTMVPIVRVGLRALGGHARTTAADEIHANMCRVALAPMSEFGVTRANAAALAEAIASTAALASEWPAFACESHTYHWRDSALRCVHCGETSRPSAV